MSEDYLIETVTASPTRFERFLKVFIVIAVLCLGAELVWLLGITPFRPFSRIEISGYSGIERERVLNAAGITKDMSYFSADTRSMEKALMGIYSLESVRVFKHFPDRLQIVLEGRQAVASALSSVNGRTVPVLLTVRDLFSASAETKQTNPFPICFR